MRPIDLIVVHCTATAYGVPQTVADITRMHKDRGFATIGYHWLVGLNGEKWRGRPEAQPGAHVEHYNQRSIGVSYVGGLGPDGRAKDTRTPAQKQAIAEIVRDLTRRFPQAKIVGHRDLSPDRNHDGRITPDEWIKQCPCFNAITEYRSIGLPVGSKNMRLALDPRPFPDGPDAATGYAVADMSGRKPLFQRRSFWRDATGVTGGGGLMAMSYFSGFDPVTLAIVLGFVSFWAAVFIYLFRKEIFGSRP
jgi:N-acetylmuramoyl-L-alanine amidase